MLGKKQWSSLFLAALFLFFTTACGPAAPQIVEVTRLVPQVFVVTVVVTQPAPTFTPAPPSTPTITPTRDPNAPDPKLWYPLLNCPPSRLHIGNTARVTLAGGRNAIRSKPDVQSSENIVSYAEPGELMTVLEGPVCNWNWLLWKVKTTATGAEGWTPEGDGKVWWLEPAG